MARCRGDEVGDLEQSRRHERMTGSMPYGPEIHIIVAAPRQSAAFFRCKASGALTRRYSRMAVRAGREISKRGSSELNKN